jgi:hypothetical protein
LITALMMVGVAEKGEDALGLSRPQSVQATDNASLLRDSPPTTHSPAHGIKADLGCALALPELHEPP